MEGTIDAGTSGETAKADGVVSNAEEIISGRGGQVAGSAFFVTPINFYVSGGGEDVFVSIAEVSFFRLALRTFPRFFFFDVVDFFLCESLERGAYEFPSFVNDGGFGVG